MMSDSVLKALLIASLEAWVVETLDVNKIEQTGAISADHVVGYIDEPVDLKAVADRILATLLAHPQEVKAFLEPSP